MKWNPGPAWAGQTAVIVGGGESLSLAQVRLIGIAKAAGRVRVIAVNDAVYPCWFADVCYSSDAAWWTFHNQVHGFQGRKVRLLHKDLTLDDTMSYVEHSGIDGFDGVNGVIRHGANSGYAALHIAANLGVAKAILVAFDMTGRHWFGDHPKGLISAHGDHSYAKNFETIVSPLKIRGVAVINASVNRTLKVFPYGSLETLIGEPHGSDRRRQRTPA